MQRLGLAVSLLLAAASTFACSEEAGGGDGGDTGGGSGGTTGGSTTGGSGMTGGSGTTGGSTTGGSAGAGPTGGAGGNNTGGGGGAGPSGGTGGGAGGGGLMFRGVCEQAAIANATTTAYTGTEEFYILSQEAVEDGRVDDPVPADMLCRIRFDVSRAGAAPAGCQEPNGDPCAWTNEVEYSNPEVLIDVDGACARSEIGWDMAWIMETDGSRVSYGYIDMFKSHDSVVMTYSTMTSTWIELGRSYWNPDTGEFNFKNRFGACRY
jgi:hypothetical protein